MLNIVDSASLLAHRAHMNQRRKYTGEPYITHPRRVAARVTAYPGATEEMIAAAWLHDVVEDTECTIEYIEFSFSPIVAKLVLELTNPSKGTLLCRADRKKMDRDHLAAVSHEAKIIKLFDRIDNLKDMKGSTQKFRLLYCSESLLLANAIGDADVNLDKELRVAVLLLSI